MSLGSFLKVITVKNRLSTYRNYVLPVKPMDGSASGIRIHIVLIAVLFVLSPLTYSEVPSELSIEEAIAIALRTHPAVIERQALVRGTEGLVQQADLRPNPLLNFQTENWRFYGEPSFAAGSDLDIFAYVSQPFERGDKRQKRVDLAKQGQRIAELEVSKLEWEIRQNVRIAYWRALSAQKEYELIQNSTVLFQEVVDFNKIMFEQGTIPEGDLIRVQLEKGRLVLEEQNAQIASAGMMNELFKTMGLSRQTNEIRLTGQPLLEIKSGGVQYSELLDKMQVRKPDIQIARAEVERARLNWVLEEAHSKPNWDLILGYKRTEGFNTLLAGVTIPLPISDKNQGNVYFRLNEIDRAEATLRLRIQEAEAEIYALVDSIRNRYGMLKQLQETVLAQADESWNIARAAYAEGAGELLRLIDAQRTRNEMNILRNRIELELQIELVQLEKMVGQEGLQVGESLLVLEETN